MENCVKALKKCPCKVFASLCFLAVLLSGIICLIGLTYDGSAKWIDWANLIVNIIGTIGLTLFIYWMGSVRAEQNREEKKRIETLNILFSEYTRFAQKLIFSVTEIKRINHEASFSLYLISNNKLTQPQFDESRNIVLKAPSSLIHFNLKESELSFMASEDPELYLQILSFYEKLYNLEGTLGKYTKDIENELGAYREELRKRGGTPLTGGLISINEIDMFFRRIENITIPAIQMLECCIYILQKLLIDSPAYANKYYQNKVILNSTIIFEPFTKIMNYKFEKFDPKCERIG